MSRRYSTSSFARIALVATATLGLPSVAAAQSIMEALALAYDGNSTLNAQRAATRAADEQLPQALSGFRPTVNLTADAGFSRSRTQGYSSGSFTVRSGTNPYGYGVQIQQSLFNGFRTVNGVKAAEAAIRASRETLANVEQNTLLSAANAYAGVVFARRLLDIRRRNIAFLSEQLRSSQARLDVGEGTRTDVAQSDALLALARAQLFAAEAQLATAEGSYFQVIGQRPGALERPRGPVALYPPSLDAALTSGVPRHPAVRATQDLVDFAVFNTKVAEGAFLPTLSADAALSRRNNTSDNTTDTDTATATVRLSVPLYQGGSASSAVRQNKEVESQRRIEVDQARDQIRNEIVTAWSTLQSARANVGANTAQVAASQLALSGVTEERNVGQRTQLDVLNAQSVVLQAQELLIAAEQAEVTAGYRLVAGIGRLNSRTLGLRVAHYEPKDHYTAVKDKWYGLRTPTGR